MLPEQKAYLEKIIAALKVAPGIASTGATLTALTPIFASLLMAQMCFGAKMPPSDLDERRFMRISSNWTASGCEAVFMDTENGQKYQVTIEPTKGEENG